MNSASISFPLFGEGFVLNPPAYFTILGFNIYYYGLFITAGFALAAIYLIKRNEVFGLTRDNILDLIIIAVPAGIVGARLYYIAFNPENYFGAGNWQHILSIRDGGLAVYGGIILSGAAFLVYSRIKKIQIGKLLDAAGFGLFIGQAVGRLGNFFNREAFGVQTEVPWRMGFTFDRTTIASTPDMTFNSGVTYYFHPAFLYEMLWNIAGLLLMHIFSKKYKPKYHGMFFLLYVAWYGLGRFMIEGLRVDSLFIPGTQIRASQLLAALSCVAAIALLIFMHFREKVSSIGASKETTETDSDDDEEKDETDLDESEEKVETDPDESEDKTGTDSDESEEKTGTDSDENKEKTGTDSDESEEKTGTDSDESEEKTGTDSDENKEKTEADPD